MLIQQGFYGSQFQFYRNDLTAESAEDAEEEKREMNNFDARNYYGASLAFPRRVVVYHLAMAGAQFSK